MTESARIQMAVEAMANLDRAIVNEDWRLVKEVRRQLRPLARFTPAGHESEPAT